MLERVNGLPEFKNTPEREFPERLVALPDHKSIPAIERRFRETAKLLPVYVLMDLIFAVCGKYYGLDE